jgi:hypothetical protein
VESARVYSIRIPMKNIIIIIAFSLFTFQSCYYDKEDLLYPFDCDTTNITYSLTVTPIINDHCLACHGSSNYNSLGGNLNLEGYNNIMVPVNSGALLNAIEHNAGYSPMPKNSPQLSDCNILKIKKWIEAGASDN